jgi:hypothetical protein
VPLSDTQKCGAARTHTFSELTVTEPGWSGAGMRKLVAAIAARRKRTTEVAKPLCPQTER